MPERQDEDSRYRRHQKVLGVEHAMDQLVIENGGSCMTTARGTPAHIPGWDGRNAGVPAESLRRRLEELQMLRMIPALRARWEADVQAARRIAELVVEAAEHVRSGESRAGDEGGVDDDSAELDAYVTEILLKATTLEEAEAAVRKLRPIDP
eukprot:NODE_2842_length_866_cov_379.230580.p2 GENE.NODE_2842_length_866_cov_379.230580~~NODE_2842_length_866_cov_379.230580.p2  ORF type:complete len:152 (-),score=32.77 NODE_2842_length_866_cov_379.230580:188-643(-)